DWGDQCFALGKKIRCPGKKRKYLLTLFAFRRAGGYIYV
ncbi:MAG: hypothetical protein AVDCRST_MAG56-5397, partial [uncultured Cytophagales bacterium]